MQMKVMWWLRYYCFLHNIKGFNPAAMYLGMREQKLKLDVLNNDATTF